jgi:hypothetical protein
MTDKDSIGFKISRREALRATLWGALAYSVNARAREPRFLTRGVVIIPADLSLKDWPERAHKAGLNTIGLYANPSLDGLVEFLASEPGRAFLETCRKLEIQVEYERHALKTFLPRELFRSSDKKMFRMNALGLRTPDFNCCPSSPQALEIISEKAVEYGRKLKPASGRYYFWADDVSRWCHCPKCKGLSNSDQAMLIENAMAEALRKHLDPAATLSHLAYGSTLLAPRSVKPHPGLFLEFAPINRVYDRAIDDPDARINPLLPAPKTNAEYLEILGENMNVFPRETAQVLEYWLDVSRFSYWRRPARKLPWSDEIVKADADAYARRGIRYVTTFAAWIDADYVRRFGDPPLTQYGQALNG